MDFDVIKTEDEDRYQENLEKDTAYLRWLELSDLPQKNAPKKSKTFFEFLVSKIFAENK